MLSCLTAIGIAASPSHISIGMLHHYPPEAINTARRFAARWQGRPHVLPIEWVGVGAVATVRRADPLVSDPDFLTLHRNSWYADRQPHVSLRLLIAWPDIMVASKERHR